MRPRPPERTAGVRAEQVRVRRSLTDAEIRSALEAQPDLCLLEEQLLFRLCCLSLLRGYAWIGQVRLAALLRCSERRLRDAIRTVCDRGLLVTVRGTAGLTYLPQWQALGLDPPEPGAGRDRHDLPMLLGSTSGSTTKYGKQHARDAPTARPRDAPALSPPAAPARPPLKVPEPLAETLCEKLGIAAYRTLSRLFTGELATASPELSIEALRRLTERREVRNPAGLFITMLRSDLAARDEALDEGMIAGLARERERRDKLARIEALERRALAAKVRGDFDEADRLRDELAVLIGAPTRREQREAQKRERRRRALRCGEVRAKPDLPLSMSYGTYDT